MQCYAVQPNLLLQCSATVQCNAILCSACYLVHAMQCSITVHCYAVQYNVVQCNTIQCSSAVLCCAVQFFAVQCCAVQRNAMLNMNLNFIALTSICHYVFSLAVASQVHYEDGSLEELHQVLTARGAPNPIKQPYQMLYIFLLFIHCFP